jgi:pimeloyl-ACP methyl ester carboxylesterase
VPHIRVWRPSSVDSVRGVALLLHGGEEVSKARAHRLRPAYLRMLPFAHDLHRTGRAHGISVWLLCNTVRGWNKPDLDPVADARFALDRVRAAHPGVPVALVGHSMGGRVAFRVADDPAVVSVCALAPWTTEHDHVEQLAGREVLIAHGDRDTVTNPRDSYEYAERVKAVTDTVCRFDIRGEGHAMLRRPGEWTRLVRRFVLGTLDGGAAHAAIVEAMRRPSPAGLRVPL